MEERRAGAAAEFRPLREGASDRRSKESVEIEQGRPAGHSLVFPPKKGITKSILFRAAVSKMYGIWIAGWS